MDDETELISVFEGLLRSAWVGTDPEGNLGIDLNADPYGVGLQTYVADGQAGLPPLAPPLDYRPLADLAGQGGGLWGLLGRIIGDGFTAIRLKPGPHVEPLPEILCRFAAPLTDLLSAPSAAVLYIDGVASLVFDRQGRINNPEDVRVDRLPSGRVDCLMADRVPADVHPFLLDGATDGFWELVLHSGQRPLFTGSGELGKWDPALGYVAIFTSRQDAIDAMQVLDSHRPIESSAAQTLGEGGLLSPKTIPALRAWLRSVWAFNQFRTTKVVINPHISRHHAGVIDPATGPYVRTSRGWWRIEDDNRITLDHICHQHYGLDSFHWDGTFGWPLGDPPEVFGAPAGTVLDQIRSSPRAERKRIASAPEMIPVSPPADLADAFAFATTDVLTEKLSFRFFEDHLAALQWLMRYEAEFERPWNEHGQVVDRERFRRAEEERIWRSLSRQFQVTVGDLIEEAISEDYSLEFSRRLAAYVNHLFRSVRVEVCGYSTDIASSVRDRQLEWSLLQAALGVDAPTVSARMAARGDYEVSTAALRRCHDQLGQAACELLSPRALWFLATGLGHLAETGSNDHTDQAGAVLGMAKALEAELGVLLEEVRSRLVAEAPRDDDGTPLGRYLNGGRALTLGELLHYLRKKDGADSVHSAALCEAIRAIGASIVLEKQWWSRLKSLALDLRNRAAHTDAVRSADAAKCYALVIGSAQKVGLLPSLVSSWKDSDLVLGSAQIGGRRSIEVDHIAVVFSADEVAAQDGELAEHDDEADDAAPAVSTVEGAQLSCRIDDLIDLHKPPSGPLVLTTSAVARDGVVELIQRIWSKERVERLAQALSRRVVRWSGQGDEIYSTGDGGLVLSFSSSAGGTAPVKLSAAGREEFALVMSDLASGRYGEVLSRAVAPDRHGLEDLAEMHWERMRQRRTSRGWTES